MWPCPSPAWSFCFRRENAVRATLVPSASPAQEKPRTSALGTGSVWTESTARARVCVERASAGQPVRPAWRASIRHPLRPRCAPSLTQAGCPNQPEMQEKRVIRHVLPHQPVWGGGGRLESRPLSCELQELLCCVICNGQ